jgi:hypothetical protein
VNRRSASTYEGGRSAASGRRGGETASHMLLIVVQRTWYVHGFLWRIFLFICFGDRFRFDYLESFWKLLRRFAASSTVPSAPAYHFFRFMKNLHHLEEEEGNRLCLCKGFVVRIGVIVMIEREKRMCGNFVVKSVRYFVLVNISLKELVQHFVQRPSGID